MLKKIFTNTQMQYTTGAFKAVFKRDFEIQPPPPEIVVKYKIL